MCSAYLVTPRTKLPGATKLQRHVINAIWCVTGIHTVPNKTSDCVVNTGRRTQEHRCAWQKGWHGKNGIRIRLYGRTWRLRTTRGGSLNTFDRLGSGLGSFDGLRRGLGRSLNTFDRLGSGLGSFDGLRRGLARSFQLHRRLCFEVGKVFVEELCTSLHRALTFEMGSLASSEIGIVLSLATGALKHDCLTLPTPRVERITDLVGTHRKHVCL